MLSHQPEVLSWPGSNDGVQSCARKHLHMGANATALSLSSASHLMSRVDNSQARSIQTSRITDSRHRRCSQPLMATASRASRQMPHSPRAACSPKPTTLSSCCAASSISLCTILQIVHNWLSHSTTSSHLFNQWTPLVSQQTVLPRLPLLCSMQLWATCSKSSAVLCPSPHLLARLPKVCRRPRLREWRFPGPAASPAPPSRPSSVMPNRGRSTASPTLPVRSRRGSGAVALKLPPLEVTCYNFSGKPECT